MTRVSMILGNESFERKRIDATIQIGASIITVDTLTYGNAVDTSFFVPSGTYVVSVTSVAGEVDFSKAVTIDSAVYFDIRYTYGQSEESIKTLELIKKNLSLKDARFVEDASKNKSKIILYFSKDPIPYR